VRQTEVSLLERINAYKKRIDFFLSILKREGEQVSGRHFLFIGCGSGLEALCLKQEIPDSLVVGIDINRDAFLKLENKVDFIVCDSLLFPFRDEVFDFVYCYHVLEHVVHYQKCIEEMKRILKGNGGLFLATPNRRRLISYISSAEKTSLYEAIKWNFSEWLARFRGNFLPGKYHCGFYEEELQMSLANIFAQVACVTIEYDVHASQTSFLKLFVKLFHLLGILRLMTASHTFYCRKSLY
jgi:ubiquinone/menaquinone biosynthesis C-methylase UbiE